MESIISECGDTGATTWSCTYTLNSSSTNPMYIFDNELTGNFIFFVGVIIFLLVGFAVVKFIIKV